MIRWGGGRRKVEWLVNRIFVPKRLARIREIWRRIFSLGKSSVGTRCWIQQTLGKDELTCKKSKIWSLKPVKDKYSSNSFLFPSLRYWKVVCIQKTVFYFTNCLKYCRTFLLGPVWHLRYFLLKVKGERNREKKRKKKRNCWETFLFDVFLLTKYFPVFEKKKIRRKERTDYWISSLFVLIVAY